MISKNTIEDIFNIGLSNGNQFVEVFFEDTTKNAFTVRNNKVVHPIAGRDIGVGVRIINNEKVSYFFSTNLIREKLISSLNSFCKDANSLYPVNYDESKQGVTAFNFIDNKEIKETEKHIKARLAYEEALFAHKEIDHVEVYYKDSIQRVGIANTNGINVSEVRVRTRFGIETVATQGNRIETGVYSPGFSNDLNHFSNKFIIQSAKKSALMAVNKLSSKKPPNGKMPVIIGNGSGGVLFHEACGHALEAGTISKKNSIFQEAIGEKIASEHITYVDNGVLRNSWGTTGIDDEGYVTRNNILIEGGVLQNYLVDYKSSLELGIKNNGSSRRQSFRYQPTARMSNTYLKAGEHTPESILNSTARGIYVKTIGGGSVNPKTGNFNFSIVEGYFIENGIIKYPIKDTKIIGNSKTVLKDIDMVGNDLKIEAGLCNSISGIIPVTIGQPTIRVSSLIVS
jgi:TldD protein